MITLKCPSCGWVDGYTLCVECSKDGVVHSEFECSHCGQGMRVSIKLRAICNVESVDNKPTCKM